MSQSKSKWAWLPEHMPGVAKLIAERRKEYGSAFVDECWRNGVLLRKPGWFFAREGALAVGTVWPEVADVAGWEVTSTQCMLLTALPTCPPA